MSTDFSCEWHYFMEDEEVDVWTLCHSAINIVGLLDVGKRP